MDTEILKMSQALLKKFRINVIQILNNSDNTMEDIEQESYLTVLELKDSIIKNKRVFINTLKTRCLKFNKYNRRIESNERWEKYNEYEDRMVQTAENSYDIDEDKLCMLIDIKNLIGEENYQFLINYYSYGANFMAEKSGLNEVAIRKRASNLIKNIREELGVCK